MAEAPILVDTNDRGVATVRLNRPEVNNAYNGEMLAALTQTVEALGSDDAIRVVILRGNGRHFQAGADLNWIKEHAARDFDANLAASRDTTFAVHGLTVCPKPTIALIHGGCFGGGTGIAAACDVVVATDDAVFAITEVRWGLVATPIIPQLLARIGAGRLRRYSLACDRFDARRAYEIGLVDEVCAGDALDETAAPIVDALLHCPPDAIAGSKATTLKAAGLDFSKRDLEDMARLHAERRMTETAMEGLNSFLEKRKPNWFPGQ